MKLLNLKSNVKVYRHLFNIVVFLLTCSLLLAAGLLNFCSSSPNFPDNVQINMSKW